MLATFLYALALVCIFDLFVLFVIGAARQRWLPFRAVCALLASVCVAAFIAVAVS